MDKAFFFLLLEFVAMIFLMGQGEEVVIGQIQFIMKQTMPTFSISVLKTTKNM